MSTETATATAVLGYKVVTTDDIKTFELAFKGFTGKGYFPVLVKKSSNLGTETLSYICLGKNIETGEVDGVYVVTLMRVVYPGAKYKIVNIKRIRKTDGPVEVTTPTPEQQATFDKQYPTIIGHGYHLYACILINHNLVDFIAEEYYTVWPPEQHLVVLPNKENTSKSTEPMIGSAAGRFGQYRRPTELEMVLAREEYNKHKIYPFDSRYILPILVATRSTTGVNEYIYLVEEFDGLFSEGIYELRFNYTYGGELIEDSYSMKVSYPCGN